MCLHAGRVEVMQNISNCAIFIYDDVKMGAKARILLTFVQVFAVGVSQVGVRFTILLHSRHLLY